MAPAKTNMLDEFCEFVLLCVLRLIAKHILSLFHKNVQAGLKKWNKRKKTEEVKTKLLIYGGIKTPHSVGQRMF